MTVNPRIASVLTKFLGEPQVSGISIGQSGLVVSPPGRLQRQADAVVKSRRPHGWRRRLRIVTVVVLVLLTPVAWSLGRALTSPGTDSASARIAEWARNHHAGGFVTWLEKETYKAPKVGGTPASNSPLVAGQPQISPGNPARPLFALPPAVRPFASPALPGEGTWHVLQIVKHRPALAAAYVRPDVKHTSYTSLIAWVNPQALRAVWHPGSGEPGGGPWPTKPNLAGRDRTGLVAAFNSAFRLQDAHGGFYGYGRTLSPLRQGAASLVIGKNGRMTVGEWGRDVTMSPSVSVVRQNLALLVDHGRLVPGISSNAGNKWGATLGNSYYVWRSGIGVTRRGAIVYVAGNGLSALTLAELLQRGGAVRAMELDINPEWTSFILYRTPHGRTAEHNALPDMQQPARRYDQLSSRDFVALYAR